jgi:hypothetical protein
VPNTLPEGFAPFALPSYTPETQAPSPKVGSGSFLATISIIVGIVVGLGTIFGVVGKAIYVERSEYQQKLVKDVQDSGALATTLEKISARIAQQESVLGRMEVSLDRLATDVQALKLEAARRHRP